jgi:hypothetical protein
MQNKLILIRNTVRLTCVWVPTGDSNRPLACVWVRTKAPQPVNHAPYKDEAGPESGMVHLCA